MCQWIEHFIPSHHPPLLVTGLGVGVHLTLLRSLSFGLEDSLPSQLANLPMTSARLVAAVPIVDLSSNRLAAGVSAPGASALLGVHEGGGIDPFLSEFEPIPTVVGVRPPRLGIPNRPAFARKLFAAFVESLCEMRSRDEGGAMWKGVLGVEISSVAAAVAGSSSDCDRIRGVALSVPHVISCFTAAGPSSDGVGEGIAGTNEKLLIVGDLGRSVVTNVSKKESGK